MNDVQINEKVSQTQNLELDILRDQVKMLMNENTKHKIMRSGSQPDLKDMNTLNHGKEEEFANTQNTFHKLPSLKSSKKSMSQPNLL